MPPTRRHHRRLPCDERSSSLMEGQMGNPSMSICTCCQLLSSPSVGRNNRKPLNRRCMSSTRKIILGCDGPSQARPCLALEVCGAGTRCHSAANAPFTPCPHHHHPYHRYATAHIPRCFVESPVLFTQAWTPRLSPSMKHQCFDAGLFVSMN